MNIELGLNKKVRRAYGIDEIALVPGNRTLDYDLTDPSWSIGDFKREVPNLQNCKEQNKEISDKKSDIFLLTEDNKSIASKIKNKEEEMSVSTFDDVNSSISSVRVIEVQEISESEQAKKEKENNDLDLEERTINVENENLKDTEIKEVVQSDRDFLSLEEILNIELEKMSAAGVCWHLSRDRRRTLCMFYVK